MRKLISAKDIEESILKDQKIIYLDGTEIITPSAKELASASGIVLTTDKESNKKDVSVCSESLDPSNIDLESMIRIFKTMMNKGLLQEMIQCLEQSNKPFEAQIHENGLKVVRGNTVQMESFDTGNPNDKVYFQELVSKEESQMSAGFLHIEESNFEWELTYEEIDYVIEGTLTVEIDGHKYVAHPGDVLFVPSGSKVIWGSPDKAKVFYATYPANWPDLL